MFVCVDKLEDTLKKVETSFPEEAAWIKKRREETERMKKELEISLKKQEELRSQIREQREYGIRLKEQLAALPKTKLSTRARLAVNSRVKRIAKPENVELIIRLKQENERLMEELLQVKMIKIPLPADY